MLGFFFPQTQRQQLYGLLRFSQNFFFMVPSGGKGQMLSGLCMVREVQLRRLLFGFCYQDDLTALVALWYVQRPFGFRWFLRVVCCEWAARSLRGVFSWVGGFAVF